MAEILEPYKRLYTVFMEVFEGFFIVYDFRLSMEPTRLSFKNVFLKEVCDFCWSIV